MLKKDTQFLLFEMELFLNHYGKFFDKKSFFISRSLYFSELSLRKDARKRLFG